MRLFELAYCCRLFAESAGDDAPSARFRAVTAQRTGAPVDLSIGAHRTALLRWLREWGCRSLRREDERRCSDALRDWWQVYRGGLPRPGTTLHALSEAELDALAQAYGALAQTIGPRRRLGDRLIDLRFGATAAGKAMYAIRPDACVPWDDAIRRALGFGTGADAYRGALIRARAELGEAIADAGGEVAQLPALVGRPSSTGPKLVDEHDWVRYTAGHEPPPRAELERWLTWLDRAQLSD